MKIQGLQPGQYTASQGASAYARSQATPQAPAQGRGEVYTGERASRASAIMAGQDLGNISRNELKALADRLYDEGVITGEQRLDLTAPYVGKVNAQMQDVTDPDEKRDFLADLSAALDAVKRLQPNDASSISYLEKVNNLANSLGALS